MIRSNAARFRDCLKHAKLIHDRVENFVALHRQFFAPEIFAVEETRMRAGGDFMIPCSFNRAAHRIGIPRMKAASNVGRRHKREKLFIVTSAFSEIGVEIDI